MIRLALALLLLAIACTIETSISNCDQHDPTIGEAGGQ